MDWATLSKLGAAAAAFVLLIAWMAPPTTPKPPAGASWRTEAKARQPSVTTVAPDRFARAGPRAAAGPLLLVQPERVAVAAEPKPYRAAAPVRRVRDDVDDVDDDRQQDGQDDGGNGDARYHDGYAWAARMAVEDARACRQPRGDPGEDGCLDYVRDQADEQERAAGW